MHIKRGNSLKKVTKGAYNSVYRKLGWVPIDNHTNIQGSKAHVEYVSPKPVKSGYRRNLSDIEDQPEDDSEDLDTMSYSELFTYAKDHGVSLGRTRQREEIIDLLKRELQL